MNKGNASHYQRFNSNETLNSIIKAPYRNAASRSNTALNNNHSIKSDILYNNTEGSLDISINHSHVRKLDFKTAGYLSTINDNIREGIRNLISPNRLSRMPRLRRYRTHELVQTENSYKLRTYHHDMTRKPFKEIINNGKKRNHIELGTPLPVTSCSKIVGVHNGPKRKGNIRRARKYRMDPIMSQFISRVDVGYDEDFLNYTQAMPGDWSHNSQNLIDMATPTTYQYNRYELLEGYFSRVGIDLQLPYIHDFDPRSILQLEVKPTANSGCLSKRKIAKRRKSSTVISKDIAYKYCLGVMNSNTQVLDYSLVEIGGREKRIKIKEGNTGKKLKTRVTFMMEDVPTLITQALSKHIVKDIPMTPHGFNQLSKAYGQGNLMAHINALEPHKWNIANFNCDFTGHDNHTNAEEIITALGMLRLCFKECDKIDKLFYYCASNLIYKRVVLPESNLIYQLSKGIASGHGLTSIITTLTCYGTIATGMTKVMPRSKLKDTYIMNAGDDVDGKMPCEYMTALVTEVNTNSGHTIDDIAANCGYVNSNNPKSRITFLKKKFNLFSWNDAELMTNLLHPTMSERNWGMRADNLKVLLYQSPLDMILNHKMMTLIVLYILSGYGLYQGMFEDARRLGLIPTNEHVLKVANDIKFYNTDFVEELIRRVDFGRTKEYPQISLTDIHCVDIHAYICSQLREMQNTLKKKYNWFMGTKFCLAHRTVNVLTVFDSDKVLTRPKPCTLDLDFFTRNNDRLSSLSLQ